MKLAIYLPTYKRPHKLQDVATNIERATTSEFKLYFGCEADDVESIKAAQATGHEVVINKYDPRFGYSNTIQTIYEQSDEPVFFHANDDFEFLDGWDEAAMLFLAEHPEVMVLGVHDGMPTPSYSTISFVRREYIEAFSGVVDMTNRVFYPYGHNYVDTEFTLTAQARGLWAKIETPCIKHRRVGGDETYSKNEVTSPEDAVTFKSREHLWNSINKENIMARKPLSEEERKKRSDSMKAHWAEKKKNASTTPEVVPKDTVKDSRPPVSETTRGAMVARAQEHIEKALDVLILVRNENPNMIEATQAVDALAEGTAKMGQVRGLLG